MGIECVTVAFTVYHCAATMTWSKAMYVVSKLGTINIDTVIKYKYYIFKLLSKDDMRINKNVICFEFVFH